MIEAPEPGGVNWVLEDLAAKRVGFHLVAKPRPPEQTTSAG